mmetsp:Transcript_53339/g.79686  ORF Transcript_53339/g.79686 Transcript_53339/m.79686 type:complete len:94 (-) Transcript_53339:40-321(-)|eukprot:CAMPEP_0194063162 /NCGR_PEP_ID=MMETSP0009_2-20130614/79607_1 /TAXON_ID=210454 /ORGANISM="Grammatophora oceanica, Strain CCMP 410" /LENGTH=93 /DNA_ID=CAMNT_0038715181 /DNA_START=629 /DNA_END=910 /DNA_ORIENTATION=-
MSDIMDRGEQEQRYYAPFDECAPFPLLFSVSTFERSLQYFDIMFEGALDEVGARREKRPPSYDVETKVTQKEVAQVAWKTRYKGPKEPRPSFS